MINYTWTISALDGAVLENENQQVVKTIHWRLRGEDADGVSAEIYGAQSFAEPQQDSFIAFEDITKEIAIQWLEDAMDVQLQKDNIDKQIEIITTPVTFSSPLFSDIQTVIEPMIIIEEEIIPDTTV